MEAGVDYHLCDEVGLTLVVTGGGYRGFDLDSAFTFQFARFGGGAGSIDCCESGVGRNVEVTKCGELVDQSRSFLTDESGDGFVHGLGEAG